ncbi:hypothetical protein [Rhodopirellula sp. SWK7]|uniref:hypothetical protein n=1 Tax=Rhodopirellula sp. SWK7 TaxID=595460 RepID=UPI0002BE6846|nr:hypothetical protein [Rhodopirellula sp. SWK7]EMI44012.1 secreted protein [Rhodopirellula sp. SWK7]
MKLYDSFFLIVFAFVFFTLSAGCESSDAKVVGTEDVIASYLEANPEANLDDDSDLDSAGYEED